MRLLPLGLVLMLGVMCTSVLSFAADVIPAPDNMPAVILDDGDDPEAPQVVIVAPASVKVGDMIVVDVSGSKGGGFDWKIVPDLPDARLFNDGQVMCAATGPGTTQYLIIVGCNSNGKTDIKTHIVKVLGNGPVVPEKPGVNVAGKVLDWCAGVESPTKRDDALKLSQAFASMATVIEGGAFENPGELVIATKAATKDALGENLPNWVPLLDGLMVELKAMAQAGMLQDISAHAPVWKAVAEGLNDYAQQL